MIMAVRCHPQLPGLSGGMRRFLCGENSYHSGRFFRGRKDSCIHGLRLPFQLPVSEAKSENARVSIFWHTSKIPSAGSQSGAHCYGVPHIPGIALNPLINQSIVFRGHSRAVVPAMLMRSWVSVVSELVFLKKAKQCGNSGMFAISTLVNLLPYSLPTSVASPQIACNQ